MRLHTGTIISGTLRQQDLLDAFANILALHDHHNNKKLIEGAHRLAKIDADTLHEPLTHYDECNEVIDQLSAKLQELCPIGYYFGAHPGDGSDFGVWEEEEDPTSEEFEEMMTGYEEWLDDEASKADYLHQFMKEQE